MSEHDTYTGPGWNIIPSPTMAGQPDLLGGGGWGTTPEPAHDGAGEIVDAEVVEEHPPQPDSTGREVVPGDLARDGMRAVALFRDPDSVRDLSHKATRTLLDQLRAAHHALRTHRPEAPPTRAGLQPELAMLGDAHDTLVAVRGVFDAGIKEARNLLGEVTHELADDPRRGSTSVRVADGHGGALKVTRTQPTRVRAEADEIVDVIVAHVLGRIDYAAIPKGAHAKTALAAGVAVRAALAAYRGVAESHTFKTTALDRLVEQLEADDEHDLAIRLGHAYGRVSHGNPTVKIERVQEADSE